MPDIACGGQIFDLAFHPTRSTVYTGLLTGEVKAFGYDEQGNYETNFALKPSKRSCRSLEISQNGDHLWAVGKGKALLYVGIASTINGRSNFDLALLTLPLGRSVKCGKTLTGECQAMYCLNITDVSSA
jgi:hypothetical protein